MNDAERILAREEYFAQYQKTLGELASLVKRTEQLKEEFNDRMMGNMEQRNYLNSELNAMRNIITYMLDHGCDPVEAKLTLTDDNRAENVWEKIEYDRDLYGTLSVNAPYNLTGATGAITSTATITGTGSNGPSGSYGSISIPMSTFNASSRLRP
jgi:hypothetical protein